jgi:hypothetical protein
VANPTGISWDGAGMVLDWSQEAESFSPALIGQRRWLVPGKKPDVGPGNVFS